MRLRATLIVLAALAVPPAFADDTAPPAPPAVPRPKKPIEPRRFEGGKLTDPYWGVVFEVAGLEQKSGPPQTGKLFDGKCGRVQVEIAIFEFADQLGAKERRDAETKKWEEKKRALKDLAQGDDPAPWVTFEEQSPSGGMRRHGYAWYVRGCRAFVVHAHAVTDAEGGADTVKAALAGLTVGPETGAAVHVQMASRQTEMPYDDPGVLHSAASNYMQSDASTPPRPAIALELLLRAVANLSGSPLERDPNGVLSLHADLGVAQMKTKRYDDAIQSLTKCVLLAQKTDTPGPQGAGVQYNLACALSMAGRLDDAFAALEKAFARAQWRPVPDGQLKSDTDLENCRKDPRWQKFIESRPAK